jgi:hypothetical protein
MEGVKRSIVVGPRVGRKVEDARSVIAAVVAACAPAPEYEPPPLWANPRALDAVSAALTWPLRRSGGAP